MSIPARTLSDGYQIPALGFGTYPLVGDDGYRAVRTALDAGYRLLDSAVNYENEGIVGKAARDFLTESGLDRDALTIQTKLPGRHHDYERALASIEESLARLGLDRIDVMMIHWPNPMVGKHTDAWRALVEAQRRGLVRSVGVSNFTPALLDQIVADSGVTPVVNQVEMHPWFNQAALRDSHARLGIVTEAWSPLGKRKAPFDEQPVTAAAEAHGVTPAQVVLRWHLQLESLPLPKSATPARQAANLDVFDFELTPDEVAAITAMTRDDGRLFDGDPDTHQEM
ncbi:aldo/keto reductase [Demequina capsici]|uniref:Aldo/keto reductase n=1 Tax=Demequina capsici TaxID=3075620 RepID=A0AA96FAR3_9MICO|nr:aldo/keto reductase [Demequina sp. OYTSA14]WNM24800.1 aldo/keto reductase [Demequina sp. OYTSA14]